MEKHKEIRVCLHCGNRTPFEEKGQYTYEDNEYEWDDELEESVRTAYTSIKYRLIQCEACNEPTLELEYQWFKETEMGPSSYTTWPLKKTVYPTEKELGDIPFKVGKNYKEALKVRHISPNAFAVLAERTLEAALNDKNIKGKMLGNKLQNLAESELIPKQLQDMARQLNNLRIFGAHDKEEDVTKEV